MAATLDVWEIAPESAKRVGHPAPFPVELPERLIRLYTYAEDLVVDPFMGSGSTLVAAAKLGRRYLGYDLDPAYVKIAKARVQSLEIGPKQPPTRRKSPRAAVSKASPLPANDDDFQARGSDQGRAAQAIAERVIEEAGFKIVDRNARMRGLGLAVHLVAVDAAEVTWYFDVSGAFTTTRGGLFRTDTVWKCLGRARCAREQEQGSRGAVSHRTCPDGRARVMSPFVRPGWGRSSMRSRCFLTRAAAP